MVNPPIVPVVAVILPDIVALVAVKAPAGVTLNGALAKVALPKYIPFVSALKILLPVPIDIVPPLNAPVNVPLAADKAPLKVPPPFTVKVEPFQESLLPREKLLLLSI